MLSLFSTARAQSLNTNTFLFTNTSTGASPAHTSTAAGTYTVSLTADATGGTDPYLCNWNNGTIASNIPGLVAGSHSAPVTDVNGSTAVANMPIMQPSPVVVSITGNATLCFGTTLALAALPLGGTWSCSSTAVATVNALGIVSAVAAGNATITYAYPTGCGLVTATKAITVNAAPSSPAAITGDATICNGSTATYSCATAGGNWSCSTPSLLSLLGGGLCNAVSAGVSMLTYTVGNACGSAYVTKSVTIAAGAPAITGNTAVCAGSYTTLSNTTSGGTWTSSCSGIANVLSGSSVVAGMSAGTATITYTLPGGCRKTTTVTVNGLPALITGTAKVCAGQSSMLSCTTPGGTWGSSNTVIAAVNAVTGIVTGISAGTATITYTSPAGCIRTTVFTVNPLPAPIGGTMSVCAGATTTLTDATVPAVGWASSNMPVATINSGTGIVSGVAAGTAMITYTNGLGCYNTAVVTVNSLPSAITSTAKVCVGNSLALSCADAGIVWSSASPLLSLSSAGVVTGITAGTGNVTYTNGVTGCARISVVTVNALPGAITGNPMTCVGAATTLTGIPAGGTWSCLNAAAASISSAGVVTGMNNDTASFAYTLSTGCRANYVVTINALPAALVGSGNVCVGSVITLTDATPGGTWASSNNGYATVSASGIVTGAVAGAVTITYTTGSGCRVTKPVTVSALPAAITGTLSVCAGSTVSVATTTACGTWSVSNIAIAHPSCTIGFNIGLAGISAGTTLVSYTSAAGCARTAILTVNALPVAGSITGASVVCKSATATLSNAVPGGSWSSSNTAVATISAAGVVSGIATGTAKITYTVTNVCGTARAVNTITINALPGIAAIGGSATVCAGAAINLTNTIAGGTWSVADATVALVSATGIVSGINAGTTTVTYTTSNAYCSSSAVKSIAVNPLPVAAIISGNVAVCQGASTVLAASVSGGTWGSSNPAVATVSASGTVTGISAGSASISYSNSNSCGTAVAVQVMAVIPLPVAGTISATGTVCVGAPVSLVTTGAGGAWSSSNPAVATISNAGVLTGIGAGAVTVSYTVTNSCGTSVATASVSVNPLPAAGVMTGSMIVCAGSSTSISGVNAGGLWTSSNTSVATVAGGVVAGISAGTAAISYSYTNSCGTNTATAVVTVTPMPWTDTISGPSSVCPSANIILTDATIGGAWSTSTPSVATVSSTGIVAGVASGTTVVSYTVTNGCGSVAKTKTIAVNALPDAGVISGASNICVGTTVLLTNSVSGGMWSSGNNAIATTCPCNSGHVTGVAAGVMVMSYTVTNICGSAVATAAVSVNAVPTVAASLVVPVFTGSTSAQLPFTTTGGATQYSLVWGSAAHDAGFADVTAAALTSSPLGLTVPAIAVAATYSATLTVAAGLCQSVATPISVTLNPSLNIYTYAGTGVPGNTGSNGAATAAKMGHVSSVAADCNGNTYLADYDNAVVRKVDASGVVTVIAGTGVVGWGANNVAATSTPMSNPIAVAVDGSGNVYFSDFNNHLVRKINTSGVVSTVAGNGAHAYTGDGGPATSAALYYPNGLYVDASGNLYIADAQNSVIRIVNTSGIISTFAGNGIPGYTGDGGAATAARLGHPRTVTGDAAGNIYFTDYDNGVVRKVSASGVISTVAGNGTAGYSGDGGIATSAQMWDPYGITTDAAGNLYISELHGNVIRKVNAAGIISTIAGMGYAGYTGDNGPARLALLNQPSGIAFSCSGNLLISDNNNYGVRIIGGFNRRPFFANGTVQAVSACNNGSTLSLNAALTVTDYDTTQPETWTVVSAPAHGVLTAAYSATSTGSNLVPAGLSYVPAAGYIGADIFTVQVSDGSATAHTTITVNVGLPPVAGSISGASAICGLTSVTYGNSAPGGVWSSSNTSVATIGTSGVVTTLGYGTTTLTYSVANGCGTAYSTATVSVNPMPYAGSVDGAPSVCAGGTISYGNPNAGGVWSSGDNAIATVSSTGAVTGVAPGMTTITYAITNSCGTAYAQRDIAVQQMPVVGAISGSAYVCSGATTIFTNSNPYGAWVTSDTSILSVNVVTGVAVAVAPGVATITYSVHNACGVVNVTSGITVGASTSVVKGINGPAAVCVGSTVSLTDSTSYGTWSSSDTTIAKVGYNNGLVTGIATGTAMITYAVSSSCGSSFATGIISVDPLPVAGTITGASSICAGSLIALTASLPGGVWSSGNPARATVSSTGMVTAVSAGGVYISYTMTNSCGSASAYVATPVDPLPLAAPISGPAMVCESATITLIDATSFGAWASSNPVVAYISSTGVVTGVVPGSATITYTVHNGCGYNSVVQNITVNANPVAGSVSGPSIVNAGMSITLADADAGGIWSTSDASLAVVGSTGIVTGVNPGTVTISYSVTNVCGTAVATRSVSVLVLSASITASNVTAPGGNDGCALLAVVGGTAPYSYLWSTGATTQNLAMLPAGTYSVLVTDAFGDTTSAHVTITQPSAGRMAPSGNNDQMAVEVAAYPNPFNTVTTIRFTLVTSAHATVDIFSAATGIKVATIYDEDVKAGTQEEAIFKAGNIAAGMYIYKISTGNGSFVGRLLLTQ